MQWKSIMAGDSGVWRQGNYLSVRPIVLEVRIGPYIWVLTTK